MLLKGAAHRSNKSSFEIPDVYIHFLIGNTFGSNTKYNNSKLSFSSIHWLRQSIWQACLSNRISDLFREVLWWNAIFQESGWFVMSSSWQNTNSHSASLHSGIYANRTEWSTIQAVIGRVISKLAKRAGRGCFEIKSMITLELYDMKSYYQLIVTITKFEKNITVV